MNDDGKMLPKDPKSFYGATGEWPGYRVAFNNPKVCDECGYEDECHCGPARCFSIIVDDAVRTNRGFLFQEDMMELEVSHPQLKVRMTFANRDDVIVECGEFSDSLERLLEDGAKFVYVKLANSREQLQEMGLIN